jgi:LPXTG-site transpeptidase (sortase) family protein
VGRRLVGRLNRLTPRERAAAGVIVVAVACCLAGLWLFLAPSSPQAGVLVPEGSQPLRPPPTSLATPVQSDTPATVRIIAPAGGIDVPVREGDGIHVPLQVALHYPGTAQPGMGSNSLFYAHAQPGMFLGLYQVHLGDAVTYVRADGSQVLFHVSGIRRVAWDDLTVLKPTSFEQATLLTCTSYDPQTPRLIVTTSPA